MNRIFPWLAGPTALLVAGCANTAVETVVKSDGTWSRKVELRVVRQDQKAGEGMSISPNLKMEDLFVPPTGASWTARRGKESNEDVLTLQRALKAGEELAGDVTLKAGAAKNGVAPKIVNRASIRQISPGRLEYRETLHFTGAAGAAALADLKEFKEMPVDEWVKSGLPARLATPANAKRLAQQMIGAFMDTLLGPPDPLLDQILFSPGAARFRLTNRLGPLLATVLKNTFGDQMTEAERLSAARKMVAAAGDSMGSSRDKKMEGQMGKPGASEDSSPPIFMGFSVRLPGKIVETNGIRDDATGTVSWGLYNLAPLMKDVELRAVCDVSR